jgi:hypothetical protein
METTQAATLIKLSNPHIFPDGSFSVCFQTTAGAADIRIPPSQLGDIITYLVQIAAAADSQASTHADKDMPSSTQTNKEQSPGHFAPIPVTGIGLSTGRHPDEVLLVVGIAGMSVQFGMTSSQAASLEHEFVHKLKTLSASPSSPH